MVEVGAAVVEGVVVVVAVVLVAVFVGVVAVPTVELAMFVQKFAAAVAGWLAEELMKDS